MGRCLGKEDRNRNHRFLLSGLSTHPSPGSAIAGQSAALPCAYEWGCARGIPPPGESSHGPHFRVPRSTLGRGPSPLVGISRATNYLFVFRVSTGDIRRTTAPPSKLFWVLGVGL